STAACSVAYFDSSGNSSRQGTHQVAQKVRMTTCPRRSVVDTFWPSTVTNVAGGADWPTRRSFARAARPANISHAASATAGSARSAPRRVSVGVSECICQTRAGGPTRKHLIAVEIAVDRNLHEPEDVQRPDRLQRNTWADIGHGPGRVGEIRQDTLVAALMDQVH